MSRPVKWRRVEHIPSEYTYFTPCENKRCERINDKEIINLKVEELEAVRLKDLEGLSQEEAAEKMNISRQTFQNIIEIARKKIATALIEGRDLSIGGGHYTKNVCKVKCLSCGTEYEVPFEDRKKECKKCGNGRMVCEKKKCNIHCK